MPDDMAQLLVEWVKHIPEMEIVCHEESTDYGLGDMDRRMALETVMAQCEQWADNEDNLQ